MGHHERVSIIIPTYNGGADLRRTLASVSVQTYPHFEVLVVDDDSDDGTPDQIERWPEWDYRMRLIRLTHSSGGPARPRNVGIEEATGSFIALLDDDDSWFPDKLERQLTRLRESGGSIVYSRATVQDRLNPARGQDYHQRWTPSVAGTLPEGDIWTELVRESIVPVLTVMFERKLADRVGSFDEHLTGVEDYHYWLRASAQGEHFCAVQTATATYTWSPTNLSHGRAGVQLRTLVALWLDIHRRYSYRPETAAALRKSRRALGDALLLQATQRGFSLTNRFSLGTEGLTNGPSPEAMWLAVKRLGRLAVGK